MANEADKLEGQQCYVKALEQYKKAVDKILPVIEGQCVKTTCLFVNRYDY